MYEKIKEVRKKINAAMWCKTCMNDYQCAECEHYKYALPLDYEELKLIFHILGEAEQIQHIMMTTEVIINDKRRT